MMTVCVCVCVCVCVREREKEKEVYHMCIRESVKGDKFIT